MTTLTELVETISSALHSFTGVQEQVTHLTGSATSSALTLTVEPSDAPARGVIEVGNELIYVSSTDATGATYTVPPFGRGFRGSTAASHSTNDMVVIDPAFPKSEIIKAINQVVESLGPNLFQVKTNDFEYQVTVIGHQLPADCERVLEVKAHHPDDPEDHWQPVPRWTFDTTSPLATGNTLNLYHAILQGVDIRVTYQAKFLPITTDFATAGVPESYADLILYGVAARMLRFLDPARVQLHSAENLSRAQVVQAGDAGRTANQMYAMFQSRVAEERRKLLELVPIQSNYSTR